MLSRCGRWSRTVILIALACAFAGGTPAAGHEDLIKQIAAVSRRLEAEPNAALYLRRATLRRLHAEWEAALGDLDAAARHDPADARVPLERARVLRLAKRPAPALAVIDVYLADRPDHGPALLVRARCLAALQRHAEAVDAFDRAIRALPVRQPDHYLERLDATTAGGPGREERALRGLDEGMRDLGVIVQLQLPAVDLLRALGRFDDALARLDDLRRTARRQERWYLRRAAILEHAGRRDEAIAHYRQTLAAVAALPLHIRSRAASQACAAAAERAIERLETTAMTTPPSEPAADGK